MPTGDSLYADELNDAFKYMQENNMYKEIVFYMEACESGSMFAKLEADQNILAVTATNATTPSYATYCGKDAVVQGFNMKTCLGDLFSVNWMQDTASHTISTETLTTQIQTVIKETTKSAVTVFGDTNIETEFVGEFEGIVDSGPSIVVESQETSLMSALNQFFSDASDWTTDWIEAGMDLIYGKEEL